MNERLLVRRMDYPEYYSSLETTTQDHALYDSEYRYDPYSSYEVDYFYNDNPQPSYEYESEDRPSHFSTRPKYFYPKSKRKHHFR